MIDANILDMLENIGRSVVARVNPAVTLTGTTAQDRRDQVLRTIRGTVLPRRLEFTAANGDCLAIEVNSSRVTDVFCVSDGVAPDFETTSREELADRLAQLVSDIATAPAPLELVSLQPDTTLDADDVGITFSEISKCCKAIELSAEPVVSLVPDAPKAEETQGLADLFYDGSDRFGLGRVLASAKDGTLMSTAGDCAADGSVHVSQDLMQSFARDLAGWDKDTHADLDYPQLIVMRPSGGKGTGLAVLHDGERVSVVTHEARRLGAVVGVWAALKGTDE